MKKEDVILFGAGKLGKQIMPMIGKRYNILNWTDNSESKWGCEINGMVITSPECVKGFDGKIIVATGICIYREICAQLINIGISESQIYWGRSNVNELLIPYCFKGISLEKRSLIEYDQLKNEEVICQSKKMVMIFCIFCSTYPIQLIQNISKRFQNIDISLLTASDEFKAFLGNEISHIYVYNTYSDLYNIIEQLPVYDAFQFLWIEDIWVYFRDQLRRKCRHLNLNVGGSDLYRSNEESLLYKKDLIDMADHITAETETTIEDFIKVYPEWSQKMGLLNFGVQELDYIREIDNINRKQICDKFDIPEDKIVITCGHNANKAHQHEKMLDEINKLPTSYKNKCIFVFPMTYPVNSEDYIAEIEEMLISSKINYRILRKFMNAHQMAEYAEISDIMLHVQTTDQLSSTMLEEMYAGSLVIAGSWLPYEMLRNKGIYFLSIDGIGEISATLKDVIDNLQEYRKRCIINRQLVHELSSWDNVAKKWVELWNE